MRPLQTGPARNLLTPEEAAARLGLKSAGTLAVWRCTKRYKLSWIRVGRLIRYDESEIERFLDQRTVRM